MAYSVNPTEGGEVRAEKVVIVTGPSFGTTLKLILFGAALGAAAVVAWQKQNAKPLQPTLPLDDENEVTSRLNNIAAHAKTLANRARDLVSSAAEVAGPALQNAIAEGKKAALHAEEEIKDEIRKAREGDGDDAAADNTETSTKPEQV